MVYKIFNINDMNEELVTRYFSLMTEGKRNKILNAKDKIRAAQEFAADMLARQCLSEFCDAPEFSFNLLINPGSKSVVSNFDAEISVSVCDEFVGCAVSDMPVGISLYKFVPFSFAEAQDNLRDSEIRHLFSYSKYSFAELLNIDKCCEPALMQKFSMYKSLKTAQFLASGRGIREKRNNAEFIFSATGVVCSDASYAVVKSEFSDEYLLAYAIVERCNL